MFKFWINYGSMLVRTSIQNRPSLLQCIRSFKKRPRKQVTYSVEISPYTATTHEIDTAPSAVNFFALTWDPRKHRPGSYDIPPIELATYIKKDKKNVLFHLSCDLLRKNYLNHLLQLLQDRGICSLFVTLGDKYDPALSDFRSSIKLLEHIKKSYGDYFSVGVPGFLNSNEKSISNLVEKVDKGAEFVITETVFDYHQYKKFVETCRNHGILVPIVPSMFVCDTYQQFYDYAKNAKFKIPLDMLHYLSNKDMDAAQKTIQKVARSIRSPRSDVPHVHFVTVNNELSTAHNFVLKEKIYYL